MSEEGSNNEECRHDTGDSGDEVVREDALEKLH